MRGTFVGKLNSFGRHRDVFLSIFVVGIVLLFVVPLPPVLLDGLLSLSIVLAVTTLLLTLYTEEAVEFNSFPSLLLFLTLYRLSLNIASTRLILSEARAGDIIETFGEFVTGGNQVIGLVIFILLTVINFVVITKGAGRVAEVAARFTLDAMPGKQMSIDADLNAGIIDEGEARLRREKISGEADFYGAMDGASKFVRGDAIAGIIITVVNILGGLAIGMIMKGMPWSEAVQTYTVLSVGDGLVSQIPALLISVGAGVIVTRASSKQNLAETFSKQLFSNPRVLFVTASIIMLLGLVPGMPLLVMMPMALVIAVYAYVLLKNNQSLLSELDVSTGTKSDVEEVPVQDEYVEKVLFVDSMEVELGYGLISLVDQSKGGDLLSRITIIRRQVASELGIIVPPIRIRDNMTLEPDAYVVKIKGIEVARGVLQVDSYLAMNPGNVDQKLSGKPTIEPAFGLPAIWILASQKANAEICGYTVADTISVLATHIAEIIHTYAHELLNRQEVFRLVDNAKEYASTVIEELIPNKMNIGQVLKVLQNLLRERVPVRDIVTILETLADHSAHVTDMEVLTEYVRHALSRTISQKYAGDEKVLYAITLDSKVEQMILESVQSNDFGNRVVLRPATVCKIVVEIETILEKAIEQVVQPLILTSSSSRRYVKQIIERSFPRLPVLSFNEIVSAIEINSLGVISVEVLM